MFDPLVFLCSLCIGLIYVYLTRPEQTVIKIYPNPFNVDTVVYTDNLGNCYKYRMRETACPQDSKQIKIFEPL
jgi:hypothetical protein